MTRAALPVFFDCLFVLVLLGEALFMVLLNTSYNWIKVKLPMCLHLADCPIRLFWTSTFNFRPFLAVLSPWGVLFPWYMNEGLSGSQWVHPRLSFARRDYFPKMAVWLFSAFSSWGGSTYWGRRSRSTLSLSGFSQSDPVLPLSKPVPTGHHTACAAWKLLSLARDWHRIWECPEDEEK